MSDRATVQRILNRETSASGGRWPSSLYARSPPAGGPTVRRASVQGLRRRRGVRRDLRGAARTPWPRLARPASCRSPTAFRLAVWLQGAGRRLQAGEYRFDRADDAARGRRQDRARRRLPSPVTFREGLTIGRWRRSSRNAASAPRGLHRRRARRPTLVQRSRSGGAGSRGLPVPRHLRAAAPRDSRRSSSRGWSRLR